MSWLYFIIGVVLTILGFVNISSPYFFIPFIMAALFIAIGFIAERKSHSDKTVTVAYIVANSIMTLIGLAIAISAIYLRAEMDTIPFVATLAISVLIVILMGKRTIANIKIYKEIKREKEDKDGIV